MKPPPPLLQLAALLIILTACDPVAPPPVTLSPAITPLPAGVTALQAIDADRLINTAEEVQIIDVRGEDEYRTGHLPKALHANYFTPDVAKERITALDRQQPCLIYCELGERSRQMTALLDELGFTNIRWLENGLTDWRRERLPLVK